MSADAPGAAGATLLRDVQTAVARRLRGKEDAIRLALVSMLARGHLLVEDVPGVGKTTLAQALANAVGGSFRRIQFTSDLLPADLVGTNVWNTSDATFTFRPGPLFGNVILADEINRAPPRTQSALLEAMEEGRASTDGVTRDLPDPFLVIATQNPEEHHGTYPLPESQRDRFMLRITMGGLDPEIEAGLLVDPPRRRGAAAQGAAVVDLATLRTWQERAAALPLHADLARYAQRVVAATRAHPQVRLGVGPRGALAWADAARAKALLEGRSRPNLDDLQELAVPALAHRLVLYPTGQHSGRLDGAAAAELVGAIIAATPVPL
jgi:MoxR-like ATPase